MDVTGGAVNLIPLSIKLLYTGFMLLLVPVYLRNYGPGNFLYFCDIALLFTLVGIWMESPLLLSIPLVGLLLPQVFWLADYLANLAGFRISGMTAYMFDSQRSMMLRALSAFHGWLPVLLLVLVHRTGYDGRALLVWSLIAGVLILICYFFMPPPSPSAGRGIEPVNINYVWGLSDEAPQTWVPSWVWLLVTLLGFPLLLYGPAHLLLLRVMPPPLR